MINTDFSTRPPEITTYKTVCSNENTNPILPKPQEISSPQDSPPLTQRKCIVYYNNQEKEFMAPNTIWENFNIFTALNKDQDLCTYKISFETFETLLAFLQKPDILNINKENFQNILTALDYIDIPRAKSYLNDNKEIIISILNQLDSDLQSIDKEDITSKLVTLISPDTCFEILLAWIRDPTECYKLANYISLKDNKFLHFFRELAISQHKHKKINNSEAFNEFTTLLNDLDVRNFLEIIRNLTPWPSAVKELVLKNIFKTIMKWSNDKRSAFSDQLITYFDIPPNLNIANSFNRIFSQFNDIMKKINANYPYSYGGSVLTWTRSTLTDISNAISTLDNDEIKFQSENLENFKTENIDKLKLLFNALKIPLENLNKGVEIQKQHSQKLKYIWLISLVVGAVALLVFSALMLANFMMWPSHQEMVSGVLTNVLEPRALNIFLVSLAGGGMVALPIIIGIIGWAVATPYFNQKFKKKHLFWGLHKYLYKNLCESDYKITLLK